MGIEELDKGKWYQRVAEDYWNKAKWVGGKAKDLYEWDKEWREKKGPQITTTPYLWNMLDWAGFVGTDAPAFDVEKAGTGKKDSLLGVKVPEAWKSYDTQKQFADAGIEMTPETHPTLDKLQRSANLISDTAAWPLNALQSGLEFLPDVPDLTATAAQEAWRYGDKKLNPFDINKNRDISSPQGTGAWWTKMQDMIGTNPIAKFLSAGSVVPTNMQDDYNKFWSDAAPPALKEDGTPYDPIKDKAYKDAGGKTYHDEDLSKWPLYQEYKSGSGWDTADDRRIDKRVEATMKNKPIPPGEILQDFYKFAQENMDNVVGKDGLTGAELVASPDAVNHYFKYYFDGRKEMARNDLRNEYEFQKTGQNFADWMSTDYRDEMVKKYGMYPIWEGGALFEGGERLTEMEMLSGNISPFASAPAVLNLANKDYIKELKKGKKHSDIGEPLEWSYGAYDRSPGVGIPEEHKKWFEYSTKEAEKVFESDQAQGLELAALFLLRAPANLRVPIQKWMQRTGMGRILRESMPGLFQYGSRVNFGLPKFSTIKPGGWKTGQWWKTGLNIPAQTIDFIRPKGTKTGAKSSCPGKRKINGYI
jgi:hypothetical protein